MLEKLAEGLLLTARVYRVEAHEDPLPDMDEFVEEIPMRETRLYVKKVVGLAARYAVKLGEPYADLVRLKLDSRTLNCIDF